MKTLYDKPIANIIFSEQKLKPFPLRTGTRQGGLLSTLIFNIAVEVLGMLIRRGKK